MRSKWEIGIEEDSDITKYKNEKKISQKMERQNSIKKCLSINEIKIKKEKQKGDKEDFPLIIILRKFLWKMKNL